MLYLAQYDSSFPPALRPFLLQSCQAIPKLGKETLARYLELHGLPAARFLGEPAPHFDCALVPLEGETQSSGYVLYIDAALEPEDIYYALNHAYGHLACGHLRKGDRYSHYDVLADLRSPLGPPRRWDRTVLALQHLWFQPLPVPPIEIVEHEWTIPGFEMAFERLKREERDDPALLLCAFAQRHAFAMPQIDFDIERDAQLFPHQKRGAAELVIRLQKLGVALLADSVGLGKTRTVATVIRIMRQQKMIDRAAVLTPAKLMHNWEAELRRLGLTVGTDRGQNVDVLLVNKDVFKRLSPAKAIQAVHGCKLLVIEEAHQDLRHMDNKFHQNVRAVAFETYGLLVTATPWNNRRGDIYAMLQPFAANQMGTEIPAHLFYCFSQGREEGLKVFEQDTHLFQQIYSRTTLQRTRRMLRQSEDAQVFYAPRRPYLVSVEYSPEQRRAFATLLQKITRLRLPHAHPAYRLTAREGEESHLSGIHRFLLLKRAESSMYAFALTLENLAKKEQEMYDSLLRVEEREAAIAEWLKKHYQKENEREEALWSQEDDPQPKRRMTGIQKSIELAAQKGRLRTLRKTLLEECHHEITLIREIQAEFQPLFERDPKLETIVQQIIQSTQAGKKVLCISQYVDTAYAVYKRVVEHPYLFQKGVGLVTGSQKEGVEPVQINGHVANREDVLSRFAPVSWTGDNDKKRRKKAKDNTLAEQIDIVIGSDTLSVGHNLQDARVLLNLDLCWNPMQHEQRIGRIDRPRHTDDSAPLDIYYFLNLDLIEAELQLRGTLEKRLLSTYQDTAFDDEILPGYFEMIEQLRKLRREQGTDNAYVAEADAILEEIAERSASPLEERSNHDESERAALLQLKEVAQSLHYRNEDLSLKSQYVSIGSIPLEDLKGSMYSSWPQAALIAEVQFSLLNRQGYVVGKPYYQSFYVSLNEDKSSSVITVTENSLLPIIEGLLAEPSYRSLERRHLLYLSKMMLRLERRVQQELDNRRLQVYYNKRAYGRNELLQEEGQNMAVDVEARLILVHFLL